MEEKAIRNQLAQNEGMYFHDSHYDQNQTFTWAWMMYKASENTEARTG